MNLRFLKQRLMLGIFTILTIGSINLNSQNIIYSENWQDVNLSEEQSTRYRKILNRVEQEAIIKVGIGNISNLENNRIELNILESECEGKIFKGKDVQYKSEDNYTWYGELEFNPEDTCVCRNGYLLLISKDGEKFGQIKLEDDYYTIEDIGGRNVIVQQPTNDENIKSCGGALTNEGIDGGPPVQLRSGGNCDVTILALYTPAADDAITNIQNLATSSVVITNQALRNSAISSCDLNFELVATEEFNYDETGRNFNQVLSNVRSSSFAQSRRNFHQADVVILFVDDNIMNGGGTAGIAYLGPSNNFAYGVVQSFGANNGFVFSHEVGHILGALHEPCDAHDAGANCNDSGDFEHAHTWTWKTGCLWWKKTHNRKTILYSSGAFNSDVIQHFSNPDVKVDNRRTGIENERDNARQLDANACTVANFRTGNDYLSVGINGQNEMCQYDYACLHAQISGTPGPYTYEWKFNGSGTNWNTTPIAGTNSYFCFSTPHPPFDVGDVVYFLLKVTAANGDVTYAYHSIEIEEDGYNGLLCMRSSGQTISNNLIQLSPNPTNNWLKVDASLQKESNVWIDIYNTNGVRIQSIDKGLYTEGEFSIELNVSHLHNGIHFIQLRTNEEVQRLPFIKF